MSQIDGSAISDTIGLPQVVFDVLRTEIAPGVDIERDILAKMAFRPIIRERDGPQELPLGTDGTARGNPAAALRRPLPLNYDRFEVTREFEDAYLDAVQDIGDRFFLGVTRFTTSAFMRSKLGHALKGVRRRPTHLRIGRGSLHRRARHTAAPELTGADMPIPGYTLETLDQFVGKELGVSEWVTVGQDRIDGFANATGDHQWIHVDRERAARESPAESTIAHGFLTLSALAGMTMQIGIVPDGVSQALNYGVEKVRFLAPVRSGKRIRAHAALASAEKKPGMRVLLTVSCTVEIEGEIKPAVVADLLSLMLPDPQHAAADGTPTPRPGRRCLSCTAWTRSPYSTSARTTFL